MWLERCMFQYFCICELILLDQCKSVLVGTSTCSTDCSPCWACLLAPDVRTHNPMATGVSLVTRPGTNPVLVVCSGVSLCAWHSTCLTACGRHQRSSLVAVSALLTPRRCRFADLSGYSWLQCRRRTVCHQRLGPAPHF